MLPSDVTRIVTIGDPRVAPDGAAIAYVVTWADAPANEYRSRIWLTSVPAGGPGAPATSGTGRDGLPRWSPDGTALAFVSHRSGGPGSRLNVIRLGGGEPAEIVPWPDDIDDVAWSPDGRWLAFGARRRESDDDVGDRDKDRPARRITRLNYRYDNIGWTCDRPRRLYVVPADGTAAPRAVGAAVDTDESDTGLTWSPDGEWLAFSAARDEDWDLQPFADLFVVSAHLEGAEPVRLTRAHSDGGWAYSQPSWSPDGRQLAFVLRHSRRFPFVSQIGVIDVEGGARVAGEPRLITTGLDRSCAPALSSPREPVWEAGHVWFQVADGPRLSLWRADPAGGSAPELVVGGDRAITSFDARAGVVAFSASTRTVPSELYALEAAGPGERQLTHVAGPLTTTVRMASAERFVAQSTGGAEVEAWVMRPDGFEPSRRYPALLNVHGGPFSTYGAGFLDEFQYQAGAGYVVVFCNPRGSDGYGQAWGDAIRGPKCAEAPGSGWGSVDYDDVMAVVDEAVRRFDFIDPARLGVLGGSYGGFMASWIIGHNDRFAAACSERAVNNQLTMVGTSDIGYAFQAGYVGASHLDAPEIYVATSPLTYVEHMRTPLLIIHSDNDLRCPPEQAEQLFVALRSLRRDVELVRFPGEGHEMSRSGAPRHRVQRGEIILEFFDRHLRPGESPRPA
jgi:dipeptidyl aminopeptidase/acylaminoacyl peptidase